MTKLWLAGLIVLAGCASGGSNLGELVGRVQFANASGSVQGEASLFAEGDGIRIIANIPGINERGQGFHIHSVGSCERPNFESAGPHFNPTNRQHGRLNPNGPHAGDLPNLDRSRINIVVPGIALSGPNSIFDSDGSALVVHSGIDDQRTDPSGNSGGRLLCGVIHPA